MTRDERIQAIRERYERAHKIICDLAQGKHRWQMCVPPQSDDSDITLQAPIDDCERFLTELDRLTKERDELKGELMLLRGDDPSLVSYAQLQKERDVYREALEFYGEQRNWITFKKDSMHEAKLLIDCPDRESFGYRASPESENILLIVGGKIAREALKKGELG